MSHRSTKSDGQRIPSWPGQSTALQRSLRLVDRSASVPGDARADFRDLGSKHKHFGEAAWRGAEAASSGGRPDALAAAALGRSYFTSPFDRLTQGPSTPNSNSWSDPLPAANDEEIRPPPSAASSASLAALLGADGVAR